MARKKIEYNTNPDFIPEKLEEISGKFIYNFIKERNKVSDAKWYVLLCSKTTKSGKPISISQKRREFAIRFFPEIVPGYKKIKNTKKTDLEYAKKLLEEIRRNQTNK